MAADPVTELIVWGALAFSFYLSVTDLSAIAVRIAGNGDLPDQVHSLARRRFWPVRPGESGFLDRLGTQMVLAAVPQLTAIFGLAGLYGALPPVLIIACVAELLVVAAWTIYLVALIRRSRPA